MSKRLVTILWCIAGLLAALTLIVKYGQDQGNAQPAKIAQGEVLLEDLPLEELSTLRIEDAENTLTIQKEEGQWSVGERADYKADFAKLTRLLRSLTEVPVAQSKRAGPAFNERFGMDPEAESQDNHGYEIAFLNAEGQEIQTLLVGKDTSNKGPGSAGKYIRLGDEPEAIYAVNESFFDLTADPAAWLDREFFSISGIKSIALQTNGSDSIAGWTVSRSNANSDFTVQNLKDGRQPQADKLTPLKTVLSNPLFEDVFTSEEAQKKRDESRARQLTIETFDGFKYVLDYAPAKTGETPSEGEDGDTSGYLLAVEVTANLATEREKGEGESAEEAAKADAEFAAEQKRLQEKLAREQALGGRYYRIANFTLSPLDIGLDAIAKPAGSGADEGANTPPPPQQGFGPLAPPPLPTNPPAPTPPTAPSGVESPAVQTGGANNSDALNALSEEDIKRIVEANEAAQKEAADTPAAPQ